MTHKPDRQTRGGLLPAVLAIAATYIYFLLFAQFAFLRLLQTRLPSLDWVEKAMGAMGIAGLLASLGTAALLGRIAGPRLLKIAFGACAMTAILAPSAHGVAPLLALAAMIGMVTAMLTVSLASSLRSLLPGPHFGLAVGLVGFAAIVLWQPVAAKAKAWPSAGPESPGPAIRLNDCRGLGFFSITLSFLALIWLDSAAFAIIQETPNLKGATWGSSLGQMSIGATHLGAALLAGWLIDRGHFRALLLAAFGIAGWLGSALGVGMAQNPHRIPHSFLAAAGLLLLAGWLLARRGLAMEWLRVHGLTGLAALIFYGAGFSPATAPPASPGNAGTSGTGLELAAARGRAAGVHRRGLHQLPLPIHSPPGCGPQTLRAASGRRTGRTPTPIRQPPPGPRSEQCRRPAGRGLAASAPD